MIGGAKCKNNLIYLTCQDKFYLITPFINHYISLPYKTTCKTVLLIFLVQRFSSGELGVHLITKIILRFIILVNLILEKILRYFNLVKLIMLCQKVYLNLD